MYFFVLIDKMIKKINILRDRVLLIPFLIVLLGLVPTGSALAHPHCYILNSVRFLFDDQGLSGARLDWEFDQFFASQVLEDCDSGRDGVLQDADRMCIKANYFADLKNHDYFTFVKADGRPVATGPVRDYSVSLLDHRLVYQFTLPFRIPYSHRDTEVRLAVYDPTFYCAVTFPDTMPILLDNEGDLDYGYQVVENRQETYYYGQIHPWEAVLAFCRPPCEEAPPIKTAQQDRNTAPDQPAGSEKETVPPTAAKPESAVAAGPDTGSEGVSFKPQAQKRMSFHQWLLRQQQNLYDRMATLVRATKGPERTRAIMLLIGLAFVYGLLHAAGPGHGKAVASSFVLAKGPRLGRALIFGNLIALFHGLSAIVLVLVLRLAVTAATGSAMGQADRYTRAASYSLITLMGLILTGKSIWDWKKKAPSPKVKEKNRHFLIMAVMLGLIPCPGVVLVLLFCLSMGILPLGLVMALFQTLGMALTISVVTILVTGGRKGITAVFSKHDQAALVLEHGLELAASLVVTALGLFFLSGLFRQW